MHIQHSSLYKNNMNTETRMEWDDYFISIALLASQRSPCTRLHVGSVIVKDNRMISMGYNGFIAGCPHVSHMRDGHEQSTIHSEINAICDCAKRGVSFKNLHYALSMSSVFQNDLFKWNCRDCIFRRLQQ